LPPIERPADKNAVAPRIVSPIRDRSEPVECQITEEGMSLVIKGRGNIASNAPVDRLGSFCNAERPPEISRIRGARRALNRRTALIHDYKLSGIFRINGDTRLGESAFGLRDLKCACSRSLLKRLLTEHDVGRNKHAHRKCS